GFAIGNYARLEQALCSMLAHLCKISHYDAGVIFFKITNYRARDAILDKLIREHHGTTYSAFWNSLARLIDAVSVKRNEIVHWAYIGSVVDNEVARVLIPPNLASTKHDSPQITQKDLIEFIHKCSFITGLCYKFINVFIDHPVGGSW